MLGGLTLCNALFGCIGSCYYRSLLSIYLLVGTILTAAQARPDPNPKFEPTPHAELSTRSLLSIYLLAGAILSAAQARLSLCVMRLASPRPVSPCLHRRVLQ